VGGLARTGAVVAYPCHSSRITRNAATQYHIRAHTPAERLGSDFDPVFYALVWYR